MRRATVIALILSGVGVLGLVLVFTSSDSAREHIAKTYRYVGQEPVPGDDDQSLIYASSKTPTRTAKDIADEAKPADRRVTEAGIFLRYSDDAVAVVPDPQNPQGARIYVDDEDSGYRRHFFYVGGWWGTYSGPAESFRGGGPGAGK